MPPPPRISSPSTIILSPQQQYAVNTVMEGNNIFLTGPGGAGKSHVIKAIQEWALTSGKKIQVTALTGTAAIAVGCGATTVHSWSGIRLGRDPPDETATRVGRNSKNRKSWTQTQILVVDEVSMMSKKMFELLDYVGRKVRCRNVPFGGIQLVFSGDFFQLPPIRNNGDESGDSGRFCFESPLWSRVFSLDAHIQLSTIFRQKDPVFQTLLNEVRRGQCSEKTQKLLFDRLRAKFVPEDHGGIVPTKIFSTRKEVDGLNETEFAKLPGKNMPPFRCSKRVDCPNWLYDNSPFSYSEEERIDAATFLEKEGQLEFMLAEAPCVESLYLKIGAIVMCTVNLDLTNEICNGSIGILTGFTAPDNFPIVRFNNGYVTPIQMHWWQSSVLPCTAIGQIPLKLAWAISTHKSQGATLTVAEVDIGPSVFSEGQAYVSLSRVKTLDGLYLSKFEPKRIRANPKVLAFYNSIPVTEYEFEEEEEEQEQENGEQEQEQDTETIVGNAPEEDNPQHEYTPIVQTKVDVVIDNQILPEVIHSGDNCTNANKKSYLPIAVVFPVMQTDDCALDPVMDDPPTEAYLLALRSFTCPS